MHFYSGGTVNSISETTKAIYALVRDEVAGVPWCGVAIPIAKKREGLHASKNPDEPRTIQRVEGRLYNCDVTFILHSDVQKAVGGRIGREDVDAVNLSWQRVLELKQLTKRMCSGVDHENPGMKRLDLIDERSRSIRQIQVHGVRDVVDASIGVIRTASN